MTLFRLSGLATLTLAHAAIMITTVQITFDRVHFFYSGKSAFAAEAVNKIPGTNQEIVLERRQAHLFLAEYDRELVLRIGEQEIARKAAAGDTGGYCKMKVFRIAPTRYFLCGQLSHDAHIVDVAERSIRDPGDEDRLSGATYIGVFDNDKAEPWRFISDDQRAERADEMDSSACSKHLNYTNANRAGA